jgi:hypothetical protein
MHCIIWALPRVGSTALGRALDALNEPFQLKDAFSGADAIERVCAARKSIKHLYEECPDASNIALAQAANRHGYRHIHLIRCDEFARLVSRDIATQREAWTPDLAEARFAELKLGKARLAPLDIPHLLKLHRLGIQRWQTIRLYLGTFLTVRFEDITSSDRQRRHLALRRIAAYLDMRSIERLERTLEASGQETKTVWNLVPNIAQFRKALGTGGSL